MRIITLLSLCAGVALLTSAGALANRPVATLPSGAIVDLNTGIVTTADGGHYKLSAAQLKRLRTRLVQSEAGSASAAHRLAPVVATSAATKTKRKSEKKGPSR